MYSFGNSSSARRIPVRVVKKRPLQGDVHLEPKLTSQAEAVPKKTGAGQEQVIEQADTAPGRQPPTTPAGDGAAPQPELERQPKIRESTPAERDGVDWKALAKRQQADMENFRKRQQRRAEETVMAERERLLRLMLPVADNLERALSQEAQDYASLRQGVALTQREFNRILAAEGVTKLETIGQPFDPNWHEALATLPGQARPNTIIEEIEAGYRLGDKLLRAAKVIVAA